MALHIGLLGPTNLEKFSAIVGLSRTALAKMGCDLTVIFNYDGMIKLVGDAYKTSGGSLTMLYTENSDDWNTDSYLHNLSNAQKTVRKNDWHDVLLSLVADADVVVVAGLSAGVLAELGYMKWNYQERKGRVRAIIGITELIRDGAFPPEITHDLAAIITMIPVAELGTVLPQV